jgi:hypothetical protein
LFNFTKYDIFFIDMILSQKDPRWGNLHLGTSIFYIWAKGCLLTELSEALGITPNDANEKLKSVGGFAPPKGLPDDQIEANRNLIIWDKIAQAFPGVEVRRVWNYNNDDVLASLAAGASVLVEVDAAPIGGTGKHWVRYIGDHKLHDPGTGTERPTSDFPNQSGYAVITGNVVKPEEEKPQEPAAPEGQDIDEVSGLDLNNKESYKVAAKVWKDVSDGKYISIEDFHAVLNRLSEAAGVEASTNIDELVDRVKSATVKSQGVVPATLQALPHEEKSKIVTELEELKNRLRTLLDF